MNESPILTFKKEEKTSASISGSFAAGWVFIFGSFSLYFYCNLYCFALFSHWLIIAKGYFLVSRYIIVT